MKTPSELQKNRAIGCLLGQLSGDSLGSLVEHLSAAQIAAYYPNGITELASGGPYGLCAGQPTDDSEMALSLARALVSQGAFDAQIIHGAYLSWLRSKPFDVGLTIGDALAGVPRPQSKANGALMRESVLGIFCAGREDDEVAAMARVDAALTHVNPTCTAASELFVCAIAKEIDVGLSPVDLYHYICRLAQAADVPDEVRDAVLAAQTNPPADYETYRGFVLIALQNALWQLLHAKDAAAGIIDTVRRGGDTDTNAAICGGLLGAVYGADAIPAQWKDALANCKPTEENASTTKPRPMCYWPVDAPELAVKLVSL